MLESETPDNAAARPLVSIVMPTLNQGGFILQALQSVWEQDYPAIELLVIDGGSTDETLEHLEANRERIDVLVSEPDDGTSEAINKGLQMATGEFVWVLNSDDSLYRPSTISELAEAMIADPSLGFVYGDMEMIDGEGRHIGIRHFPEYDLKTLLTDRRHLPWPGCLMRRGALEQIGYLNLALQYSNDLDFFLRLFHRYPARHLQNTTGYFRIHDSASTQVNIRESGEETVRVCREFLQGLTDSERDCIGQDVESALFLHEALTSFHTGDCKGVRRAVSRTLSSDITFLFHPKIWIYWIASLGGSRVMLAVSVLTRRLIKNTAFFRMNEAISGS